GLDAREPQKVSCRDDRNTPAEPSGHFLRGSAGHPCADTRGCVWTGNAAVARLSILRSAEDGIVLRLVCVSADRFHAAVGRLTDHLDISRCEGVVPAYQRPVSWFSSHLRPHSAETAARVCAAVP